MREVSADEAEQIYDLREKLEEISIGYAIKNYDSDDLNILEQKLNLYKNYSAPIYDRKRLELDTEFHMWYTISGAYSGEAITRLRGMETLSLRRVETLSLRGGFLIGADGIVAKLT